MVVRGTLTRRGLLRLSLTAFGTVGVAVVAACSQPQAAPTAAPQSPAAAQPTATTAAKPGTSQPSATTAPQAEATQPAAQKPQTSTGAQMVNVWFNQATQVENFRKNIVEHYHNSQDQHRLEVVIVPNEEMTTKLTAAIAGGTPPDVVRIGGPALNAVFYQKDAATAIDTFDPKIQSYDFVPAIKEALTWKGQMWAMPVNSGTMALYYNAELYERAGLDPDSPPATFDAMIDAAKKIRALGGNVWGQEFATKPNAQTSNMFHGFQFGFNARGVSADGKTVLFDSPEHLETFTWYKESVIDTDIMPIKLIDEGSATNDFGTGNLGQYGAYPSRLENGIESLGADVARTARLPAGPHGSKLPIGFGTLMIPAKATNKDGGWHFVSFIGNDPENDGVWCTAFGQLPPRQSFRESKTFTAYLKERPHLEPFLEGQKDTWTPYFGPAVGQVWTAYAKAIEAVTFGAKSPEQALKDAKQEAQAALDQELAAGAEPLPRSDE